jgi:hypothetical protein
MELIFGRNINVFSNLRCHTKVDGVLAEIACLVGSEDLKLNLIEACWGSCLALEKAWFPRES